MAASSLSFVPLHPAGGLSSDAARWLERAAARACDGAELADLIPREGIVVEVLDDAGRCVGALSAEKVGDVLRVLALGGSGGLIDAAEQWVLWAAVQSGAVAVELDTSRRGLQRVALRRGWSLVGVVGDDGRTFRRMVH